jgi:hypothetical protein
MGMALSLSPFPMEIYFFVFRQREQERAIHGSLRTQIWNGCALTLWRFSVVAWTRRKTWRRCIRSIRIFWVQTVSDMGKVKQKQKQLQHRHGRSGSKIIRGKQQTLAFGHLSAYPFSFKLGLFSFEFCNSQEAFALCWGQTSS